MCEWSEIAGGTDRTLTRDERQHALVEQVDKSLDDYGANTRVSLRQSASTEQQHRPNRAVAEPVADTGGVAAQQPHLELGRLIRFDVGGGEAPKASRYAVDGAVLCNHSFDELPCRAHALGNTGANSDRSIAVGDRDDIVDSERTSVDGDYPQALLLGRYRNTNQLQSLEMDQAKRTLNLITSSFAVAAVLAVVVLSTIDLGTPDQPDLADGAALATAAVGAVGLVVALLWTARSGERGSDPNRLMLGYVTRLAITELGVLLGIVGLFLTGSTTALYLGLGLFLLSLVVLAAGLRRIG